MIAKRPAERYPSGAALIEALSTTAWQAVPIRPPQPAPVERHDRSRWSLALGALLLAASAGTAAWHLPVAAALTGLLGGAGQPSLIRRGGQLALLTEMAGPPADGEVEVRFSDLKLYALGP